MRGPRLVQSESQGNGRCQRKNVLAVAAMKKIKGDDDDSHDDENDYYELQAELVGRRKVD